METFNQDILTSSHENTIRHRDEILKSGNCGCFYCITHFKPVDIIQWTDNGQTALCPNCGIDSVIGDKSGYPVNNIDFLKRMNSYWF